MAVPAFFTPLRRCWPLLALCVAGPALWGQTNTPSANDGFDPEVTGSVNVIALQPNGQIVVGGSFSALKPNGAVATSSRANLARLNLDGTLDTTFTTSTNAQVTALAVQPNGQIIIGGYFTSVQPNGGAAVARNHVARLNSDGSLDPTFNPDATAPLVGQVNAIALQSNGQIIIGGAFQFLQPNGAATASGINRIARLNSDGSLDATFNPNANGQVYAILIQSSGQIIIGGTFTTINGVTSNYIAQLNSDGSLNTSFNPDLNGSVVTMAAETDGKIIIGGSFTSLQPNGAATANTEDYLARLNPDGSQDISYNPDPSGPVQTMVLQANGQLLIGGYFVNLQPGTTTTTSSGTTTTNTVNTFEVSYMARVNFDGSADTSFTPNPNYLVNALALQPDGKVVVGGEFTQLKAGSAPAGVTRNGLARVYTDGSLDQNFNPDANGAVGAVVVQSDGSLIIGGSFTSVDGVTRNNLAHLSATGVVDPNYDPEPNGPVTALALQSNGLLVVGGNFTTIQPNGASSVTTVNYITRLNPDGTQDTSFTTGTNAQVEAIAIQSNGQIVIGGNFTVVGGISDNYIARLNSDSSVDGNFEPQAGGAVDAILLEPSDNAVIIGGAFTSVTPTSTEVFSSVPYIARLDGNDGALDPNFIPWPNGQVNAMALQANGQILIGGEFTTLLPGGVPAVTTTLSGGVTTITSVSNAGVETIETTVNGNTTTTTVNIYTTRNYVALLDTNGFVAPSFNPNPNSVVQAIALQSSGQVLLGGYFTNLQPNGTGATSTALGVARVNTDGSVDTTFTPAVNAQIDTITPEPNGEILIGGGFTTVQSTGATSATPINHLALLTANGTLDPAFSVSGAVGGQIDALVQQPDGHIIAGGSFANVDGIEATNIVRLDDDSTFDSSFAANANGQINAIAVQSDGTFLVGGSFSAIGAGTTNNLAHLTSAGYEDTTFTPAPNGPVNAVAVVQSTGDILVGGTFTSIGGGSQSLLARLTPVASGGTLDTTFTPTIGGSAVNAIALQNNGEILVGGSFSNINGTSCNNLGLLTANGTLDTTFNASLNGTVSAIVVLPNGQIMIGGSFTSVGGSAAPYVARLNSNGTLDKSFSAGANGPVNTLALPANSTGSSTFLGQIYAGGSFTQIGGSAISYLARLNPGGSADTTFNPNPNGPITALLLENDAKLVVGGSFSSISGLTRNGIARLSTTQAVTQSLTVTNDASVLWVMQGGPAFSQVFFQTAPDGVTWTTVGQATPVVSGGVVVPGEWTLSGLNLYTGSLQYMQAVGVVPSSENSSGGLIEAETQF